jgi:hypothetical protein
VKHYWHEPIPSDEVMEEFIQRAGRFCAAIPQWKRILICFFLKPRLWKIARAYNKVAVHNFGCSTGLWLICRYYGARVWAEIYGMPGADAPVGVDS